MCPRRHKAATRRRHAPAPIDAHPNASLDHEHDIGLAHDLALIQRRRALLGLAGVGTLIVLGCGGGNDDATTTTTTTSTDSTGGTSGGTCSVIPEETAGTYPGDGSNGANALALSGIVRGDMRTSIAGASGAAGGVPLVLTIELAVNAAALRRVLGNLIGNGLRYGTRVQVSVAGAPSEVVQILIDDDGPGIHDSKLEAVFDPFVRVETSRSRQTGGVGPGLFIARELTQRQGGTLTLSNRAQGGLRAEVRLPRVAA
jgi:hypothetical protein